MQGGLDRRHLLQQGLLVLLLQQMAVEPVYGISDAYTRSDASCCGAVAAPGIRAFVFYTRSIGDGRSRALSRTALERPHAIPANEPRYAIHM